MDVKINNSEIDFSKMATLTFDCIIENVKRSCLNYQIQLSPFSAIISIKKSFLKDQSGAVVPPTSFTGRNQEFENLHSEKVELEKEVKRLKDVNHRALEELAVAHKKIEYFEKEESSNKIKAEANVAKIDVLNNQVKELTLKNVLLSKEIVQKTSDLADSVQSSKSLSDTVQKLMKESALADDKHKDDLAVHRDKHKSQVEELKNEIVFKDLKNQQLQNEIDELKNEVLLPAILTKSSECQTVTCVDIPYDITEPLPPIFSKRLLRKTPLIKLHSNSLPDLSSICWGQPETLEDIAAEGLAVHHHNIILESLNRAASELIDEYADNLDNIGDQANYLGWFG